MKVFIILAVTILPFVACQTVDPTKICMPDRFATTIYDATNLVFGTLSVDFSLEKVSTNYIGGAKTILDLKNDLEYVIEPSGSCTRNSFGLTQDAIEQCLPSNARKMSEDSSFGSGGDTLVFQPWTVDYGSGVRVNGAFTEGSIVFPIMRQISLNGTSVDLLFFFDGTLHLENTAFEIPTDCTDGISVGK